VWVLLDPKIGRPLVHVGAVPEIAQVLPEVSVAGIDAPGAARPVLIRTGHAVPEDVRAELLHENRDASVVALIVDRPRPGDVKRPRVRAGLAADDKRVHPAPVAVL
jgi:hypothetical protein